MESLFVLFIIAGVLVSILGSVIWWIVVAWAAKTALQATGQNVETLLANMAREIEAFNRLPVGARQNRHADISEKMRRLNTQMRQLSDLDRQRYELRTSELTSMAANAGIEPPTF